MVEILIPGNDEAIKQKQKAHWRLLRYAVLADLLLALILRQLHMHFMLLFLAILLVALIAFLPNRRRRPDGTFPDGTR